MLRVNQLSGFGGAVVPSLIVSSGTDTDTNSPTFTVDLGPPGVKQVLAVFGARDTDGSDAWTWGTGTVGGESFTYIVASGRENAGNGSTFTRGITVRAMETSLSGLQTVSMPIVGFGSTMDNTAMLALVVRGVSTTPIGYDGGTNQGGSNGDNFTISTVGARIVIGGMGYASGAGGGMTGPGSGIVDVIGANDLFLSYDIAPAGTSGNVYSFSGSDKYVVAGASFG
jgi:hypothetical protein